MSTAFPWEVERAVASSRAEAASVNGGAASGNGGPARSGAVTERTAAGAAMEGTREHQRGKSVSGSQSARALSECEIPPIKRRIFMCHVPSECITSVSDKDDHILQAFAFRPFQVVFRQCIVGTTTRVSLSLS